MTTTFQRVPPSPEVMASLFLEYRRSVHYKKKSFRQYLEIIGFTDPAADIVGMDDAAHFRAGPAGPVLIAVPSKPVTGQVKVKVLLVDFPDRAGTLPATHYEDLLFSTASHPTGSMRDYYDEISLGKVTISGSVHGWLRMPQPYAFYTNGESGTKWASYPRNAPRLAEDAVNVALAQGITFDPALDKFNEGVVTALFIVHAGRGAEELHPSVSKNDIWSHKWQLRNPVPVAPGLAATIYLTVPHDCRIGVCAHELGHLALQWQDFYDPNYDEDGSEWDGSGTWDLMAGGSYNGSGARPAHPASLHKMQHGWIDATTVKTTKTLTIKPYTPTSGRTYKVVSPAFGPKQYLLLENRARKGFDFHLPGEGLLVWRVDESGEQEAAHGAGLLLLQADGRHDLEDPTGWNQGDAGDPFPGSARKTSLGDTGSVSTSFPDGRSGISLSNIKRDAATGTITVNVTIRPGADPAGPGRSPARGAPGARAAAARPRAPKPTAGKRRARASR